jgi:sugar phosphate isomerase/epimerase
MKMSLKRKGAKEKEPMDLPKLLKILRAANYQGWFTLEYEENEDAEGAVPGILKEMAALLK